MLNVGSGPTRKFASLALLVAVAGIGLSTSASADCPPRKNNPNLTISGTIESVIVGDGGMGIRPKGCKMDIIVTEKNVKGQCKAGSHFKATGEYQRCDDNSETGSCYDLIGDSMYQSKVTCTP